MLDDCLQKESYGSRPTYAYASAGEYVIRACIRETLNLFNVSLGSAPTKIAERFRRPPLEADLLRVSPQDRGNREERDRAGRCADYQVSHRDREEYT